MEAQMKVAGRVGLPWSALAAGTRLLSLWKLHPLNEDEIEYFRASHWIATRCRRGCETLAWRC